MCNIVCRLKLDAKTVKEFKEKIDDEYRVNMYETYFIDDICANCCLNSFIFYHLIVFLYACYRILDNLPLVVPRQRLDQESTIVYQLGFHVGLKGQYSGVGCWISNSVSCW